MRYQRQAITIIAILASINEIEAFLGCSPSDSFLLKPQPTKRIGQRRAIYFSRKSDHGDDAGNISPDSKPKSSINNETPKLSRSKYVLSDNTTFGDIEEDGLYWNTATPVTKNVASTESTTPIPDAKESTLDDGTSKCDDDSDLVQEGVSPGEGDASMPPSSTPSTRYDLGIGKNTPIEYLRQTKENDPKKWLTNTKEGQFLSRACVVYDATSSNNESNDKVDLRDGGNQKQDKRKDDTGEYHMSQIPIEQDADANANVTNQTEMNYEDIDQSIPLTVYDPDRNIDLIWSLLRTEAKIEAQREPLLVSFLYSTILNHPSLESALAFHLANRLASASMDSIQVMNIILEALEKSPTFRRDLRADIIAVRDRDPACAALPDVFLYFKGFHALQSYRVANYLWNSGRKTLAHYFQSQMSQNFQIDIHPKATLKSGIMIDHGTGVVIGETAVVGYNCSILHHVTLGGSGKRGVVRHPNIGDGALLGAGATILGNVHVGKGCQVGAGTLVIDDLPDHSVAVGVPAKIIGTYKTQEAQPARTMNQVGSKESESTIIPFMI